MACCFGFGPNESDIAIDADRADNSGASPILNLDESVKAWGYEKMKAYYKRQHNCFQPEFPKMKDCVMKVLWSEVYFSKGKIVKPSAYQMESNGQADTNLGEIDDPNTIDQAHIETFVMKCANSLNEPIETTLTPQRTVKSTYEVTVHKGVETGKTLRLEMQLGNEDVAQAGAQFEFSKILEHYNESKKTEVVETKWTNAYPVKIDKGKVATARFDNKYQTFKKALYLESKFHGTINITLKSKKKVGGKFMEKLVSSEAYYIFRDIKEGNTESALNEYLELDKENEENEENEENSENKKKLEVKYKSKITLASNTAVNQDVVITQEDIPKNDIPQITRSAIA